MSHTINIKSKNNRQYVDKISYQPVPGIQTMRKLIMCCCMCKD